MGWWVGLHLEDWFEKLWRNLEHGLAIVFLEMTVANWSSLGCMFVVECVLAEIELQRYVPPTHWLQSHQPVLAYKTHSRTICTTFQLII